jgi:hypothetical protein
VDLGDAATAVDNAAVVIDPSAEFFLRGTTARAAS